ncbi:portal protein [Vibrio phage 1.184.A._10N.286.49.A5]|nr:portal protein [Vibrio phage 1.184.A._10N.286.49.A5]
MSKSKIEKLYDKPVKPQKKKGDKSDDGLLQTARKRSRDGATYWKDNWEAAEDDLMFLAGEQWPSQVRTERELEQRPCLVNNVLPTFVDQVLGDQRQNRPAIKVSATDVVRVPDSETGEDTTLRISNTTGKTDYELAEVFTGLIKNIEYNCDAETSYDIAFQSAVESGMGYLRVRSDYLADETFEQDLIIDHIENQFAVTMDPNAKERDRSDMNWCLIDDTMEKEAFKEHYPDANADPVNSDSVDDMGTWYSDNSVKISEYFTREPCVKEVALLSDGRSVYMDELEPVVDELLAKGVSIVRTRKVKTYKVFWRKITGLDVLEGPVELPCSTIPVVPVWGKALVIKKKVIFRSIIRHSKDAQRMANYWDSAATEAVALAPKAPFIGSEGHTEGYEHQWETANTVNRSVLTYVPQFQGDLGPRREQPAAIPAAEITLGMNSSEKIKATLGMYDASLGAMGNETSGRAIVARQRQGDRGSFAFIDNLTKAIRRVGKICVEMIPKIYDTERVVRLKFSDESEDFVKLNEQILDEQTNEWVTINDLNVAKYDVVVTTGPAYSTQRQEAAESLIQFATAVPSAAAVMADLIAQNMDFPGADVMAERLKRIIPPNVLSQKERDAMSEDAPQQEEPTPEQQIQMKELEVRSQEAEAKSVTAQANNEKSAATIAKAQSDLVQAQLETAEAQSQLQAIQNGQGDAYQQVRELVAEALAELMANNQDVKA